MRTRFPLAIVAITAVVGLLAFSWLTNVSRSQDTGAPAPGAVPPAPMPADPTVGGPELPAPAEGDDKLDGAEVLTRGPVHEAFASPSLLDPQAPPTIPKKPPEAIEELPPDERPEGDNIIWIPGYWAWDDERADFIWISGLYRNAPPNQTWVPGHWNEVAGSGYQWTSGFWTSTKQAEVTYLEQAPPASVEAGPSSPAPSEDHFWVPGNWVYQDVRYVWQPGYWTPAQTNWCWVPARYQWCPSGYVFIPGYWDYMPISRGCLFAPVYFTQPLYYQPAFVYRPAVVINTGFFSANLFCRPAFSSYYFGDYFAVRYSNVGFRPWFSVAVGIGGRPCYDPFFTYYHCHNRRHDRDWLVRDQRRYDNLRRDEHGRPPHTFVAAKKDFGRGGRGDRDDVVIAKSVKDVKRDGSFAGVKMREVDRNDREVFAKQASEIKKVARERTEIEKKSDVARTQNNPDRRRDGDAKQAVRVSDKKLKLPTVATIGKPDGKPDASTRNRSDNVTRAVDSAKKNDITDRSQRTTGPRLADTDKKDSDTKQTPSGDVKKLDTDRSRTAINKQTQGQTRSQGLGQSNTDARRNDRSARDPVATDLTKQRDAAADATKKAIDRARSTTTPSNPGTTTGPVLSRPDAVRRQTGVATNNQLGSNQPGGNQPGSTVRRSTTQLNPSGGNPATTQRRSTGSAQPQQTRSNLQPGGSSANRTTRSLQTPPQQSTRSTPQPRVQPRVTNPPSGGSPGSNKEGESKKRSGRSADASSPRSDVALTQSSPNLSNITRSVDQQVKSDRESPTFVKDDTAARVRDEVRGTPRGSADSTARRGPEPTSDLRLPSNNGFSRPGVAQSDAGGPARGPTDGNQPQAGGPDAEPRKSFANDGGAAPRDGSRSTTNPRLSDGASPGRAPVSQYDILMQQGKSLSRANVRERPGTVDDAGNVDPRKTKDPIGSIGWGATPRRMGTPRTDSTVGRSSGGIGIDDPNKRSASSSSGQPTLPRWESGQRPQLPRLERGAAGSFGGSTSRTYDPLRGR
jgi:hypothetical protein